MYNLSFGSSTHSLFDFSCYNSVDQTTPSAPSEQLEDQENTDQMSIVFTNNDSAERTDEKLVEDQTLLLLSDLHVTDEHLNYSDLSLAELLITSAIKKYSNSPLLSFNSAASDCFYTIIVNTALHLSSYIEDLSEGNCAIDFENCLFFREGDKCNFTKKTIESHLNTVHNTSNFLIISELAPSSGTKENDFTRIIEAINTHKSFSSDTTDAYSQFMARLDKFSDLGELHLLLDISLSTALFLANTFYFETTDLSKLFLETALNSINENALAEFTAMYIIHLLEQIVEKQQTENNTNTHQIDVNESGAKTVPVYFQNKLRSKKELTDDFFGQFTLEWAENELSNPKLITHIDLFLEQQNKTLDHYFFKVQDGIYYLPLFLSYFSDWVSISLITFKESTTGEHTQLLKLLPTILLCQVFESLTNGFINYSNKENIHPRHNIETYHQYKDIFTLIVTECHLQEESLSYIYSSVKKLLLHSKLSIELWIDLFQVYMEIQFFNSHMDVENRSCVIEQLVNIVTESTAPVFTLDLLEQREWLQESINDNTLIEKCTKYTELVQYLLKKIAESQLSHQNILRLQNQLETHLLDCLFKYATSIIELMKYGSQIVETFVKKGAINAKNHLRKIHISGIKHIIKILHSFNTEKAQEIEKNITHEIVAILPDELT